MSPAFRAVVASALERMEFDVSTAATADEALKKVSESMEVLRDLLGLPEPAELVHVHRWTYAKPAPGGDRTYHLDDDGIGLAGDAFGTPRVQSAWRSGRDLGRALAERLVAVRG